MLLNFQLVTPPAAEPVSLELAKQHCRVDFPDDDLLIQTYIIAARQYAEQYTNRAFYTQQRMLSRDHFPLPRFQTTLTPEQRSDWPFFGSAWDYFAIRLPKPTCISVDSVTYLDLTATKQTLDPSTYYVDTISEPARLVPTQNLFWPYTQQYLPGSVKITFTAGSYGDGVSVNNCPQTIVMAMLLLIGHWYEHRENASELNLKNIPNGVESLLDLHKFHSLDYE
jgi:uncharacterized phiE125 gp8 family phage protein